MSVVNGMIDCTYGKHNGWGQKRDAPLITSSVVSVAEALIQQQIGCRNADISVQFDPSTAALTLRGVADSYYQKQLAQEAVRHLDQIAFVVNRLGVRELVSRSHVRDDRKSTAIPETDGESS